MKTIITIVALALSLSELMSSTFETKSYFIQIESFCPEGHVTCDDMRFTVKEKNEGIVSEATGTTLHSFGKDGITPSRFLGYKFILSDQTYFIRMEGMLLIRNKLGNKVFEEFEGVWDHKSDPVATGQRR